MNKLRRSYLDYCRLGSLATLTWLSCSVTAIASPSTSDGFDCTACTILSQSELEVQRGGFSFAGLSFEFGANIRSFIDNRLVLESIITIMQDGTIQHQAVSLPDNMPGATQVTNVTPQPGPGTPKSVITNAPPDVDLPGLGNALGVSVNDHKGFTAALHEATRQRITSTLINTASHRDLRQELEVRVNVENFRQFHQDVRQSLLNNRIDASRLR
ncbi:MAG: hypothetical protein LC646_08910 [Xanthomonadaceae bacterium]|nr:hypothetical protein [Xanthomonadaceae bacterium]